MTIHTVMRRQLPLLLYGELTGWREETLRRHLQRCPRCQQEYEQLQALHALLSAAHTDTVPEPVVVEARRRLRFEIESQHGERLTRPARFGELLPRLRLPPRRVLAGAAQVLAGAAAGFVLAILFWPSESSGRAALEGVPPEQIRIENVHFLGDDDTGEELELTLEAFRPVQVRGSVDDPLIQRLLARAILSDRNAGVRLRAVSVLRAPAPNEVDPEIRQALLTAITTDENAGVRMAALEAVRQLPLDQQNRDALLHVLLYDTNPGLRIAAINALEAFMTDFTREDDAVLRGHMGDLESDENAYVRWKAKKVLLERGTL